MPPTHFLRRVRLLEALEGEQTAPVTLLLAPAGYGKSVLLGQVQERLSQLAFRCWLLDARQTSGDGAGLAGVMLRAWTQQGPVTELGRANKLLQQAKKRPIEAVELAQALRDVSPRWVLLDHAERLLPDGQAWLLEWLRALPVGWRMVVAARALSGYELPLLVASGQVQVFGPEQLAFSETEVGQLVGQELDRQVVGEQSGVSELAQLRGWPLGIRLALSGAYGQDVRALLRGLFEQLSAELQAGLPYLAPYDCWTPSLAAQLGLHFSGDWPQQLILASLPVLRQPDGTFAPHDALIDFLEEVLRSGPQNEWEQAYRRAAEQALVAGQPRRAVTLLNHAGLYAEALALARREAPTLHRLGLFGSLRDLLSSLPAELVAGCPSLSVLQGAALVELGEVGGGVEALHRARQGAAAWRALPELAHGQYMLSRLEDAQAVLTEARHYWDSYDLPAQVRLLTVEGSVLRDCGENKESLEVLRRAEIMAQQAQLLLPLAQVKAALGITFFRLNRGDEALAAGEESLSLFEQAGAWHHMTAPLIGLAVSYRSRGDLNRSRELLRRAEELALVQNTNALTSVSFGLANAAQLEGQFTEAASLFTQAISRARASGRTDFEYMSQLLLSETQRALGQHELADVALHLAEQLRETHPQLQKNNVLEQLLGFVCGLRALAAGQLQQARAYFEAFPAGLGGIAAWYPRAQLHLAQLALARGEPFDLPLERFIEKHLIQESTLYLVPDLDYLQPILQEAVRRGLYTEELRPLLQEAAAPRPRWKLEVRTLGGLGLYLDGQELAFTGSNVARARELLALLALLPPPTSADLQRVLVGAGKGDHRNALNSLRGTLRAATGEPDPLRQDAQRRYLLSPAFELSSDIDQLREALKTGNTATLQDLLARGEFLVGLERDWVQELREEEVGPLRVAGYLELGAGAVEAQRYDEAKGWYERALELDPLQARAAQTLFELCRAQQDRAGLRFLEREYGDLLRVAR